MPTPPQPPKHTPPPQGLPPQPQGVPPPPPPGNVAVGGGHLAKKGEEPKPGPGGYRPTIGVKGEAIDDGERDPDTIAEEQRARSDDIEKEGLEKWKAARDERKGESAEPRKVTATVQIESHKAT